MKIKTLNSLSIEDLTQMLEEYVYSLNIKEDIFHFLPAQSGLTNAGKNLKLGFSCYALKMIYILDKWDSLQLDKKNKWIASINDFQITNSEFPANSFIDDSYIYFYKNQGVEVHIKETIKKILNKSNKYNFELRKEALYYFVRAETKQALATLKQVGENSKFVYQDYPKEDQEIKNYLNEFDWSKPWSSGAQFAGLCVFSSTNDQSSYKEKESLINFIDKIVNSEDGGYYSGDTPNLTELVNGTMKIITGLDWLDYSIHYPEKLIDLCLNNKPSQAGCDLVDYVYVLFRCSKETNYRKKEIVLYLLDLVELISNHFFPDTGGFSYDINKSQKLYYGVKITNQKNVADLHGTLLLTWALSMIFNLSERSDNTWNILKP